MLPTTTMVTSPSRLYERIEAQLQRRSERGIMRRLTLFESEEEGEKWTDFSSNDYLSFARSGEIKTAYHVRLQDWSALHPELPLTSSSGSRLLDGNLSLAEQVCLFFDSDLAATTDLWQVEQRCAEHFGSEDALLFNTGFAANVSLLAFLPQEGDVVLYDELIHASMHDGLRRSRAKAHSFRHSDPESLRQLIETELATLTGTIFVAVEGVYSMDGDLCPLPALLAAAARVPSDQLCVVVDEAHSVGIYGESGRGVCSAWGVQVPIRLVTFGKALGASGAVLLCDSRVKQFLLNYARPLIYSTALPPVVLLTMLTSLEALKSSFHARAQRNVLRRARELRHQLKVPPCPGVVAAQRCPSHWTLQYGSPIVPYVLEEAKALAAFLQEHRLVVRGITYPSVPKGANRVRVCLHAQTSREDIQRLTALLQHWRPGAKL